MATSLYGREHDDLGPLPGADWSYWCGMLAECLRTWQNAKSELNREVASALTVVTLAEYEEAMLR